jgi:hypothetical protein
MAISIALAKGLLETVLGAVPYTPPSTWYFGLSSSPITNGTLPNNAEPPVGIGYARTAIPNSQLVGANSGSFNPAQTSATRPIGYITNAQTITMDEIIGGSEPVVQYFFLSQSAQNSNASGASKQVDIWGSFDRARTLQVNSNLIIEAGGAVFEIVNV